MKQREKNGGKKTEQISRSLIYMQLESKKRDESRKNI